ncbi:ATP-binding cassette domain-containing protein, partial [Staphylococcus sp. SIMBA_130]
MEKILEVNNLHVSFDTFAGEVQAVRGVNFHLNKGETLAIVGESGSGKSVTSKAVMRLIPNPPGRIKEGEIKFG